MCSALSRARAGGNGYKASFYIIIRIGYFFKPIDSPSFSSFLYYYIIMLVSRCVEGVGVRNFLFFGRRMDVTVVVVSFLSRLLRGRFI